MDRQAVENEIRAHVPSFDALPLDIQTNLIETRIRQQSNSDQPASADRAQLVQQKFAALAAANGLDISSSHPVWGAAESSLRDRLRAEAEASLPAAPSPEPDFVIDEADPRATLRVAQRELAEAVAEHEAVQLACDRATTRLSRAEAEIKQYAGLDEQIASWSTDQVRSDLDEPMPYHLASGQADRSRALDRADHAKAAQIRLQSELRHIAANVQLHERHVRAAATAVCFQHADQIAAELAELDAQVLTRQEQLVALAYTSLGGLNGGAPPLPPKVRQAINAPPATPQRRAEIEQIWRAAHTALMREADAPVEIG